MDWHARGCACCSTTATGGAAARRRLATLGTTLRTQTDGSAAATSASPASASGAAAVVGHDGTNELLYDQANPRPLPEWAPAERAKHEELMRRAFTLANMAVDNGNCPYAGLLARAVHADGSGGEIVLEHCNGVKGKDGPGQYLGTPGLPDLTDHGECGAIRAASALLPHDQLATLTLCRLR